MASWNQLWAPGGLRVLRGGPQGLRRPQLWRVELGPQPRGSQGFAGGGVSPVSPGPPVSHLGGGGTRMAGGQERMGCRTGMLGGWFGFGGTRGQLRAGRAFPQRAPCFIMGWGCLSCTATQLGAETQGPTDPCKTDKVGRALPAEGRVHAGAWRPHQETALRVVWPAPHGCLWLCLCPAPWSPGDRRSDPKWPGKLPSCPSGLHHLASGCL